MRKLSPVAGNEICTQIYINISINYYLMVAVGQWAIEVVSVSIRSISIEHVHYKKLPNVAIYEYIGIIVWSRQE